MWIESEHADRNFVYQLYNNFSGCLSEEDKKKLKKIENYCGHQTLMKIFVKCYYLDEKKKPKYLDCPYTG